MPAGKIKPHVIARIQRMIADGASYRVAADKCGVSLATVQKYANAEPVSASNANALESDLPELPDDADHIHAEYADMFHGLAMTDRAGASQALKFAIGLCKLGYRPDYRGDMILIMKSCDDLQLRADLLYVDCSLGRKPWEEYEKLFS